MCVHECLCVGRCVRVQEDPQRPNTSDILELEIQVGESYPEWVLGTQLGSSEQQMLLTTESSLQPQEFCFGEFQIFSHQLLRRSPLNIALIFHFFFFLTVLGIEPKASQLTAKLPTTELYPQPSTVIFRNQKQDTEKQRIKKLLQH